MPAIPVCVIVGNWKNVKRYVLTIIGDLEGN